ncbi:MAG: EAL domain-containing protein [Sulfuricella sp.]|jgi:diguanylate cyclase (GGDEF)-like protein|nr:EAL domain-containing protein [Sulfuricella sp.]
MKNWGIKRRVLFLALMPASVIALLLALHFITSGIQSLEDSLRERGLAIARQLAPASEYGVFSGNREILQLLADSVMKEADVSAVTITNIDGAILAASGKSMGPPVLSDHKAGLYVAVADQGDALSFSTPVFQSQTEVDDFMPIAAASQTVAPKGKILGRVTLELSRASTRKHKTFLILDSLLIFLLGLAASTLLALRMSRDVTVPVKRLADAVDELGRGRLDVRVVEQSGGELRTLERGVNAMAAALQAAQERMQERVDEATERLSYLATHDALTGLVNRREFEHRLEKALASAREEGWAHALCYLDLDQFKIVNDTCGHVAGDELLRQLTVLLQSKVRDTDLLARLGGDEFGVLLENCPLEQAQIVADLLRQTVKDFHFVWQNKAFVIGVSIGLVPLTQDCESLASVLSCADSACYAAKDMGRNRVHVYRVEDSELAQRQGEMNWVARITHAIEENRFRLYYQTIMPLAEADEAGAHFEILLRMLDDQGELIPPMAFIPAAERYNLMPSIDRWVVSTAFGLYWKIFSGDSLSQRHTCTVNLSGPSLCDDHFLSFINRQFALYQVPHDHICFEITETAAISNLSRAMEFIGELRSRGCRFSLDDFGSGLSSFTYLKNMPVDYLKIDGSFVRDMVNDPMDAAMVAAINQVGHVMGLKTIAEFVETEAVLEKLREMGVDFVQGFGIEHPRPLEGIVNLTWPFHYPRPDRPEQT